MRMRKNMLTRHTWQSIRSSDRAMAVEEELMTVRQRLRDGENVSDALHTLNTLLEATGSGARIQEIVSFLSLQLLFETLSTVASASCNEELRSLTCRILGKIFASLPPEEVCRQRLYLELGLQHDREEVRRLCLDAISGHLDAGEVREMMGSRTMFHLVTQIVGDDSLHCAGLASELLLAVLAHPASLDPSVRSGLLIDMEGLVAKSDTVRFRVYDLVVRLSLSNDESFEFAVSTRLLHRMVEELQSGDVLVQMNSVELVLSLLNGKQGARFLESQGVVGTMHSLLLSVQNDPLGSIIVPSIFKFYGHISCSKAVDFPAVTQRYPEFLASVLSACLSPEDDTRWGVAVDTLGFLGSTPPGREALNSSAERSREVVRSLGEVIARGHSDLRIRALHTFSVVFSCPEDSSEESNEEGWSSERYFHHIHPNLPSVIMALLKQPFDDLRTAGLELLRSLASHHWGQKILSGQPGLLEFLLDRRPSLSKLGKDAKYEVVSALVNSSTAEKCFGSPNFLKLRKYYREGPFFVVGEQVVAMEESAE